ncbi:MAG TPA: hypothetical protein P5571_06015 [Candidatus Krumholzibacteria bacterium]|nr:hypothetical protein [Candidatus Krumholzibacteria bacterium]HRX50896.1 hypothetical protein [Candidatus Krumholzibacteria bacterium]
MALRVTEHQIAQMIYLGTQNNLGRMAELQEQSASGRRVNSYADDPRGVSLTRHYESLLSQNDQYRSNIGRARTIVENTDTALQDLLEVLRDAATVARREVSGASSNWQTRNVGAAEVEGVIGQAISLLNQSVEGSSLFGGFRTDLDPFIRSATGEVQYQGDTNIMQVRIGPSTQIGINVPGSELLGSDRSVLSGFGDLSPRLDPTTALSAISHGNGWSMGSIQFTDASGIEKTVDLSGAGTIADVISILGAAGLTAAISADGSGLAVTDPAGGPLSIRDAAGGDTATTLGIVGASDAGVIDGSDIRASAGWTQNLVDIDSLAGALPLGSIHLEMDGQDVTIDLSAAATLDDVRTAFESAVTAAGLPPLTMELSGAAINVVSITGASWVISNEPGDGTADALGLSGEGRPARLFGTLENLVAALRADDTTAIRTAIGELEGIEQHILELEIQVAGRETMLDWMDGLLTDRDLQLETNLSKVRDADIIEVASNLAQAETAYQASLLVSSKLLQMNLFHYL